MNKGAVCVDRKVDLPLPSDDDAERAILGAILIDNALVTQAIGTLAINDFYNPIHRKIFAAVVALSKSNRTIDAIVIGEELRKDSSVEPVGGRSTVTNLTYGLPHFTDISHWIGIVREKSKKRKLIKALYAGIYQAANGSGFVSDLAITLSRTIDQLANGKESAQNAIGLTFGELVDLKIPDRKEVMFGIARGEWGIWNSVTNKGKTTMLRNLTACLATRRGFPPFIASGHEPKRVAFLDFEDRLSSIKDDFLRMIEGFSSEEKELFYQNTFLICEVRNAFGEDLCLSRPEDFANVLVSLRRFKPDIILVDTIGSAFEIKNENDNAEIRSKVTRPLRRLATDANAGLMAAHHIGKAKSEEGQVREASHRGRGASSLSDMPKIVLNLEYDAIDDSVTLECAKVKGIKFTNIKFRLDPLTRWFSVVGEVAQVSCYQIILQFFDDHKEHDTAEVIKEFEDMYSERTVKEVLKRAVDNKDLVKVRHGRYRKPRDFEKVQKVQLT